MRIDNALADVKRLPATRALNHAVADTFPGRDKHAIGETVNRLCEQQADLTVLRVDSRGNVEAIYGRGGRVHDRNAIVLSNNLFLYTGDVDIVSVNEGHDHDVAATWQEAKDAFPLTVEPATFDGIPEDDGNDHPDISAVYLFNSRGIGYGPTRGCMFAATDVDSDNQIVNGYLWVPDDSDMTSEHCSYYFDDLASTGGRVSNYQPGSMTFREVLRDGIPPGREAAYRKVSGIPVST